MKHRTDTIEGVNELKMLLEGEHINWVRQKPGLRRDLTIYPETLTPEQQQRLDQIEQELLGMAYEATEENTTKTILKGKKQEEQ
jgi:hypothetical protein